MIQIADYTRYPEAFKNAGISFTEEPGWRNRGHGDIREVKFIVLHHTAGGNSDAGDIRVVRDGRPDLRGPLSQLVLKRNGQPHIIAQGVSWHAYGEVNWRGVRAGEQNWWTIGIEGVSNGYNDWTPEQRREYPRVVAALLKDMNLPSDAWAFHRETQPKSKIDPAGFERPSFQREVDKWYHGSVKKETAIQECYNNNKDLGKRTFEEEERPTADGEGRYATYEKGAIYWHPTIGAHAIKGKTYDKYASRNFELGIVGYPVGKQMELRDGGKGQIFQGGIIYESAAGAAFIHGAILETWGATDWEKGEYGYPTSDEIDLPDTIGRMQNFENGYAYWHPDTGAHFIKGLIWNEYSNQKWERGLGYPLTDELTTPVVEGRYNHFQNGSIYYKLGTARAFTVSGVFLSVWGDLGWEHSRLGWPIVNEYRKDGFARQDFETGSIEYDLEQTRIIINGKYVTVNKTPVQTKPPVKPELKPQSKPGYQETETETMLLPDKERKGGISHFANKDDKSTRGRFMGITGEPADNPWDQWFCAMRFGYVDWEVQSNGWLKPKNIDGIDMAGRVELKNYLRNRKLKVTNPANGKSVIVRPADVGPGVPKRMVDVSQTAIKALGAQTDNQVIIEWADPKSTLGPVK